MIHIFFELIRNKNAKIADETKTTNDTDENNYATADISVKND